MKHRSNESGIVLIMTLWIIVVLSVISLTYVKQVYLEIKMVGFQRDVSIVEEIAKAGMRQAMILLREDNIKDHGEDVAPTLYRFDDDDVFNYDGGNEPWAEGIVDNEDLYVDYPFYQSGDKKGYYFVTVEDESAKFPINNMKTNIEMIRHLLELTGVEEERAMQLAAAIIDWRDPDTMITDTGQTSLGRDGSDENSFYNPERRSRARRGEVQIPEIIIKNGPLDTVDELLLIPGMTPDIVFGTVDPEAVKPRGRFGRRRLRKGEYLGLINYVTVYTNTINMNTVKSEVLEAVLFNFMGEDAESVAHEWVDFRNGRDGVPYTDDDEVMKTTDNSDLDDAHYTEADGFTDELWKQLQGIGIVSIRSSVFVITCMAEYEGVQKGYRAVVKTQYLPWDSVPEFGIDTLNLEDLQQSKIHVRLFEPLYDAKKQIQKTL